MIDVVEIARLGEFFSKFRPKDLTAHEHYLAWNENTQDKALDSYTKFCFNDAFLYISKYAENENQFYELKLELDTKRWQYELETNSQEANFSLKQIHIDQIMLIVQKVGFDIKLMIVADQCCRSCARHHGKHVTLISVLNWKHLPYSSCKRDDYCNCLYKVILNK